MIEDHIYMPDYQAMGDCRVCGHEQKKPWHIGETTVEDRIKKVDESLAKQLERSIKLNGELRISIWNEAIEAAAEIAAAMDDLIPAGKQAKFKHGKGGDWFGVYDWHNNPESFEYRTIYAISDYATAPAVGREDAARYRRLRILGCAPGESKQLKEGTVLRFTGLDVYIDADILAHPSRGEAQSAIDPIAPETSEKIRKLRR